MVKRPNDCMEKENSASVPVHTAKKLKTSHHEHSAKSSKQIRVLKLNNTPKTKSTPTSAKKPATEKATKRASLVSPEIKKPIVNPVRAQLKTPTLKLKEHEKKVSENTYSPFTVRQNKLEENLLNQYRSPSIPQFKNVICIEGNIGSGKSTLLRQLESRGYTVLQEPVNKTWYKYLPLLYSDPKRWGMTFQVEVLQWFDELRRKLLPALRNESCVIVERSAQSSFYIFVSNLYKCGQMCDWEYEKIKWIYQMAVWKPMKTLYLQLDTDECMTRIQLRNRKGEEGIPRDLIENLNYLHERVWARNTDKDIDVICLDAGQSIQEVSRQANEHIEAYLRSKGEDTPSIASSSD